MKKRYGTIGLLLITMVAGGCKKAFLNKIPSTELVVPSTLSDYQELLDNTTVMGYTPVLGDVSSDNLYLPDSFWQTLDVSEKNAYIWAADLYDGQGLIGDWDMPYQQVFYANEVLEGLAQIPVTTANQAQWQAEQGSALFLRAYAFYNIASLFAPPYDSTTAAMDLGIPLRLHSDVTAPSVRATVTATYAQITGDLQQARQLLPPTVPAQNRNRPSQPAALALLARVYLAMRNYGQAGRYADTALASYDSLMDYKDIDTITSFPFSKLNPETLYQSNVMTYTECLAALGYPNTIIDSGLYQSYGPGDLRRCLFYRINRTGLPNLKGSYANLIWPFTGLATDELYLVRAECSARAGQLTLALADLNQLLRHRYATGTFTPVTASSAADALNTILLERRKELAFRGVRWTDLRRLNKEDRNIQLQRILAGQTYTLPPNSNLYTLPIPPDVLHDNPQMLQNKR